LDFLLFFTITTFPRTDFLSGRELDKQVPVACMLELAQADPHHPYTGGETAFYDYVRKVRRAGLGPAF